MNEKTFEEQFPSLENRDFNCDLSCSVFTKEMIIETCLDKQRVIEVINKYVKCDCKLFPKHCELHKILKELGL